MTSREVTFDLTAREDSWEIEPGRVVTGWTYAGSVPVRVGELQVWDVINETPLDHPFHLHGFFFQVLEENGHPPAYIVPGRTR